MKEHLNNVENKHGRISYLSPLVQNKCLQLMESAVHLKWLHSIKAKYFDLIFDFTLNRAHQEQMTEKIRYFDNFFL